MDRRVYENIIEHGLIDREDNILIGLSGGPDSVYLFHQLLAFRKEVPFKIYIAHVNHGVRGEEAKRDEDFVRDLSRKYNIPFYLKKADMDGYARELGISKEDAGRRIRYGFFREILRDLGGGKIAVGHNKNDQAETMLMRFFRGASLDGLKGMDFKADDIIRPILNIDREDIEAYLLDRDLDAKIDRTNLETLYMRNRTRLELIPYIEDNYNKNLIDTLTRNGEILREDGEFLNQLAQREFKSLASLDPKRVSLDLMTLNKLDYPISSRVLRLAIKEVKGDLHGIEKGHIDLILDLAKTGKTGKSLNIIDNLIFKTSYGLGIVEEEIHAENFKLELEDSLSLGDYKLEFSKISASSYWSKSREEGSKYIDLDKVKGDLFLRNRRPGDYFQPLGMKGRKKLKDIFIDEKVPRDLRDRIPLLCDSENIVWILGYRVSEIYKVDKETKNILKIKYQGGQNGE